jgi:hypothetical protein
MNPENPKKKVGRPRKGTSEIMHGLRVMVNVPPRYEEQLRALSEKQGVALSVFFRMAGLKELDRLQRLAARRKAA